MKSYRVLMVHEDPCIRVLKEVQALVSLGVKIDILCQSLRLNPQLRQFVQNVYEVITPLGIQDFLQQRYREWDIIHCHNEPNTITAIAISECAERPVIYDCHDMSSARNPLQGTEATLEELCFKGSRGIIHVSEGLKKLAFAKYGPSLSIVLPSFPLASDNCIGAKPKLLGKHIVYQGTIAPISRRGFLYRYYLPMFRALLEAGLHIHVFSSRAAVVGQEFIEYQNLAKESKFFHLYDPLPYGELIATMSQFQWGFSGFNLQYIDNTDTINFLNYALPNKFFDYLLAGVCPVVINNATTAEFARRIGAGYAASDMTEFIRICTEEEPLPPLSDLSVIDMGTQIEKLISLYEAVSA